MIVVVYDTNSGAARRFDALIGAGLIPANRRDAILALEDA